MDKSVTLSKSTQVANVSVISRSYRPTFVIFPTNFLLPEDAIIDIAAMRKPKRVPAAPPIEEQADRSLSSGKWGIWKKATPYTSSATTQLLKNIVTFTKVRFEVCTALSM